MNVSNENAQRMIRQVFMDDTAEEETLPSDDAASLLPIEEARRIALKAIAMAKQRESAKVEPARQAEKKDQVDKLSQPADDGLASAMLTAPVAKSALPQVVNLPDFYERISAHVVSGDFDGGTLAQLRSSFQGTEREMLKLAIVGMQERLLISPSVKGEWTSEPLAGEELRDLAEQRLITEFYIACRLADRWQGNDLLPLERLNQELAKLLDVYGEAFPFAEYCRLDLEFHLEMARIAGCGIFTESLRRGFYGVNRGLHRKKSLAIARKVLEDHREILDAIRERSPSAIHDGFQTHFVYPLKEMHNVPVRNISLPPGFSDMLALHRRTKFGTLRKLNEDVDSVFAFQSADTMPIEMVKALSNPEIVDSMCPALGIKEVPFLYLHSSNRQLRLWKSMGHDVSAFPTEDDLREHGGVLRQQIEAKCGDRAANRILQVACEWGEGMIDFAYTRAICVFRNSPPILTCRRMDPDGFVAPNVEQITYHRSVALSFLQLAIDKLDVAKDQPGRILGPADAFEECLARLQEGCERVRSSTSGSLGTL